MRGQKVGNRVSRKGKTSAGAGAVQAGTSAVSVTPKSLSGTKNAVGLQPLSLPSCCGCGSLIAPEIRAVQCDRCQKEDRWKCIECLGLSNEAYDNLIECKEVFWFCHDCGCKGQATDDKEKDDKLSTVIQMMSEVMNKLMEVELELKQKVEDNVVKELQSRVEILEGKIREGSSLATQDRNDGVGLNGGERENIRSSEEEEIRKRKNNVVMYRVPELDSDDVLERRCGDVAYVHELCSEILKVDLDSGDISKTYRLGKKEEGKCRPLLVRFNSDEKKGTMMSNLNRMKGQQNEKFKGVSISHDLTVRQRELVRAVRNKALEDLEKEEGSGNFRIIVVGQTTNPRAVKVPLNLPTASS